MSFFHKIAIWCQIITPNKILNISTEFLILLFGWICSNFSFLREKQKFDQ